jgi:hypothetical protein
MSGPDANQNPSHPGACGGATRPRDPVTRPLPSSESMRTLDSSMGRRLDRVLRQITRTGGAWVAAVAYILIGLGAVDGLHRLSHAQTHGQTHGQSRAEARSCGYRTCGDRACSSQSPAQSQPESESAPASQPPTDHDCGSCWICIHLSSTAGAVASTAELPRALELVAVGDAAAPPRVARLAPPAEVAARPPPVS